MQDRDTPSDNTTERCALYLRISADRAGKSLGVERQEEACRELALRHGWDVVEVFRDNDLSAYSGKRRPGYESLLKLMTTGEINVVVSLHTDRLHRSPTELETFISVCEANDVRVETVQAGPIDLSTATGRMGARIYGAVARHEVEHAIERMRAAKLQAAKQGRYLGGQRPFGFEPQRTAIREDEADVLRYMAGEIIKGESYRSIALDLNRKGILTQHGKKWGAINVRNVLIRPINAGIVMHKGIEYSAKTPAIFTPDEWSALQVAIRRNRSKSKHPGRFRKHMLNGLLYCGVCGEKLFHKSKQQRDGSYRTAAACGKTDSQTGEQRGCGGVSRQVDPIIDLVTAAALYRVDSPDLAQRIQRQRAGTSDLRSLIDAQEALSNRISKLSNDHYVRGLIDDDEFERLKIEASAQMAEIQKAIEKSARSTILPDISITGELRTAWESASIEWRRDLLFALIERIVINPKPKVEGYYPPKYKQWWFDPELVDIRWRV